MGMWDGMKGPKPLKMGRWTKRAKGGAGGGRDAESVPGKTRGGRGAAEESIAGREMDVTGKTAGKSVNTTSKGRIGEDAILECLLQKGLKLLERNWHCGHKEVDLIMEGSDGLHFVEVRSRSLGLRQTPSETVDAGKRHRIAAAADVYVRMVESVADVHFDIAAVYCDDVTGKVLHTEYFPDAFIAFK